VLFILAFLMYQIVCEIIIEHIVAVSCSETVALDLPLPDTTNDLDFFLALGRCYNIRYVTYNVNLPEPCLIGC